MKLCFRGIHYHQQTSEIKYTEGEVRGKYRGNPWKSRYHHCCPKRKLHKFTYRGVSYTHYIGIDH